MRGSNNLGKTAVLLLLLLVPSVYITLCYDNGRKPIPNIVNFKPKLSAYQLFQNRMAELKPCAGVKMLEISSTLFTDYSEKLRLIKLPKGTQMISNGNGLPFFPDGTIIAKTFYYSQSNGKRKIIETRLLILKNTVWNAATYRWNNDQSEAELIVNSATIPISFSSKDGKARKITYYIPSQKDCADCHRVGNELVPIGAKLKNLNMLVARDGKKVNQLIYFKEKGLLKLDRAAFINPLPNYKNHSVPLQQRAKAYFEMNCAHCHNPSGIAARQTLNLRYEQSASNSGIMLNKNNIIIRMGTMGEFHMPKIGTTIIDEEGFELIKAYLKNLH